MKCIVIAACVLSVILLGVSAAPFFPAGGIGASASLQVGPGSSVGASSSPSSTAAAPAGGGLTNILSNIDLPGLLRGVNSFVKLIGAFCPPLSQILDNVIQNVTSTAFRVFGRAILQSGGLGGGGSAGGQRVNVVLPTFPPDEDEDYDEDEETEATSTADNIDLRVATSNKANTTLDFDVNVSPANEENTVAKRHVRVAREAAAEEEEEVDEDQEGAESAPHPAEDLSDVDADDADRNKRFLPFGGTVEGHGAGGSGNFLFDLIRNTADRAGRAVGTVYRMVAGTENLGWGLTATKETSRTLAPAPAAAPSAKLVAGSGATEESDEKANAPGGVAEIDVAKSADGYTEGIPGPITRLFVIANRGIANLVQDLILRLAQTSERLVNFKARLITSLI